MTDAEFRRRAHALLSRLHLSRPGHNSEPRCRICYDDPFSTEGPDAGAEGKALLQAGDHEHPLDPSLPVDPGCTCAWVQTGVVHPQYGREVKYVPCDQCVRRAEQREAEALVTAGAPAGDLCPRCGKFRNPFFPGLHDSGCNRPKREG